MFFPVTAGGHHVYGMYMDPHEGYRNNETVDMPPNGESLGIYMVADGTHPGNRCCWNFGAVSRDNCYLQGEGSMNALNLGMTWWGAGAGDGPWFAVEGGIVLGTGGDNSNWSQGTFFEGCITNGRPTDETDEAVYRNVQAVGFGQ